MNRWAGLILAVVALVGFTGWDFSRHSVPVSEIQSGGPPKDGIPAIDHPRFVSARKAGSFLKDTDRVLGLSLGGEHKAYPIKILNWHEVVNDTVGGRRVVVSFCPLCGTGMVFHASAQSRKLNFGVSGLLYQSDMLLYDRQTESLWSQIKQEAVTGELLGARLILISSTQTTWGSWKKKHPDTKVLSTRTGYDRDYDRDPYAGYSTSRSLFFDVKNRNADYHPKEQVIGIVRDKVAKAYPFQELARSHLPVKDMVGKTKVRVLFDAKSRTAVIQDESGRALPSVVGFWFAWYAFHPDTQVYRSGKQ